MSGATARKSKGACQPTDSPAPTVSVFLSVFNAEPFVALAIESILNQTFTDFEFLIVNDGSSDRSQEIISAYVRRDPRIRAFNQQNKGQAATFNDLARLAQGEYIAVMDADDVSLPRRLEKQVEFMERHPEVGLLGGAVEHIDAQSNRLPRVHYLPLEDPEIRAALRGFGGAFYHAATLMRKEVLLSIGGYRPVLRDSLDYDLWLRMSERSKLANLPQPVLQYRIHLKQVSVRNVRHQIMCAAAARAATELRHRGEPDPLWDTNEVTPELLSRLGVGDSTIQQAVVDRCHYWIGLFAQMDGSSALQMADEVSRPPYSLRLARSVVANACLASARYHYRHRQPARALATIGRAILTRPMIAGRPIKRALRRVAALMNGSGTYPDAYPSNTD